MRYFTFCLDLGRESISAKYSLEDLGIDETMYDNEEDLSKLLQNAYEEWVWGSIETTWYEED